MDRAPRVPQDRPRVHLNCAMSADGKIALPNRTQTRISSEEDWLRVHQLRAANDAVLVGIGTILADDPSLLVRSDLVPNARQPLRVVLDSHGRIPRTSQVLKGEGSTLVAVAQGGTTDIPGAQVLVCGQGRVHLPLLLENLQGQGVRTLLVEGGEEVSWSFLRAGLFDELDIFIGDLVIGGHGPSAAGGSGAHDLSSTIPLRLLEARRMQGGLLVRYAPVER